MKIRIRSEKNGVKSYFRGRCSVVGLVLGDLGWPSPQLLICLSASSRPNATRNKATAPASAFCGWASSTPRRKLGSPAKVETDSVPDGPNPADVREVEHAAEPALPQSVARYTVRAG